MAPKMGASSLDMRSYRGATESLDARSYRDGGSLNLVRNEIVLGLNLFRNDIVLGLEEIGRRAPGTESS